MAGKAVKPLYGGHWVRESYISLLKTLTTTKTKRERKITTRKSQVQIVRESAKASQWNAETIDYKEDNTCPERYLLKGPQAPPLFFPSGT